MAYTAPTFETTAVINSTTLFKDYDDQLQILIEDVGQYLEDESNAVYQDLGAIVTDGIINDASSGNFTTYSSNKINTISDSKQPTLVSGTNIKTINSNNILGSGDISISMLSLSGVTAYHLLQGNLAVDNTVTTQGFNTTLYTGNGSTQSINTGIDMDTQWGNDASEKFGGLVWTKGRSATWAHLLFDTIRGNGAWISTQQTNAQATDTTMLSSFSSTGFNVGNNGNSNTSSATYASWNFQTTHRVSGTTNHGKAYTCHFNPFTGFTIVKYEGSGIAGHEIPHHLGRKLGLYTCKALTFADGWMTTSSSMPDGYYLEMNTTAAQTNVNARFQAQSDSAIVLTAISGANNNGSQFIMYGWANSYFDEANKLIGNYEVGIYQGTGASGNKVVTRGKPAWLMYKRLDSTSNWTVEDNQRITTLRLCPNLSDAEAATNGIAFNSDGFTFSQSYDNVSGGQYLYMVAYDTNSNGGGSYYPRATDTSNLNISNAIIPFANGVDTNGTKITTLSKNETISGLTLTAGKNYVYSKNDGTYGVKNIAPNYGKTNPANGGDFYDILENKWYTSAGAVIAESRNYLNHIVYADNDGSPLYVEELPKVEYKDIIKANEYKGKNACTAWVLADCTTTPPTILDSYGFSSVIRQATGYHRFYFSTKMDTINYGQFFGVDDGGFADSASYGAKRKQTSTTDFIDVITQYTNVSGGTQAMTNFKYTFVGIFGGKQ